MELKTIIVTRPNWTKGKMPFWHCSWCNRFNSWYVTFCPCGPFAREDEGKGSAYGFRDDSSTAVWDELSDEALVVFEEGLQEGHSNE